MPEDPHAPEDPERLPSWLGDDEPETAPAPRRGRLVVIALAVVPWLVVLGLALTGGLPSHGHTDPDATTGSAGASTTGGDDRVGDPDHGDVDPGDDGAAEPPTTTEVHDDDAETVDPDGVAEEAGAIGEVEPLEARAGAVALLVARAWLTDVGPALDVDGVRPASDHYLEHATVERVERHGDHAVVTLVAVVLERDGDVYERARPARIAVPVALDDPPRPAGPPGWLPAPQLDMAQPAVVAEDDPDELLRVAEALTTAGIDEEVVGAGRTTDGWWLVQLAEGQGDGRDASAPVWLRPGPDGPVVAGLGDSQGSPEPQDQDEEQ